MGNCQGYLGQKMSSILGYCLPLWIKKGLLPSQREKNKTLSVSIHFVPGGQKADLFSALSPAMLLGIKDLRWGG